MVINYLDNFYELFTKRNYNQIIDILYNNFDDLVDLINKTNNPQHNKEIDILNVLMKYKSIDNSKIVIAIKKIVYLIVKKEHKLIIEGKEDFADKENTEVRQEEKYYVNIIDNKKDNFQFMKKLFILHVMLFGYEALSQYKDNIMYFAGLDYEFFKQEIALAQLCLFPNNTTKFIWIWNPKDLDNIASKRLISNLYTNNAIYKILHGSDSLDTPYMFKELFNNDYDTIFAFIKRMIDTRFLCEFHKIIIHEDNKKCSLYDGLLYFGTITKTKYEQLDSLNKQMGPIHIIKWDISTMTNKNILYALYDVLFLREFMFDILRKTKLHEEINHKNMELIPELTRLVFLEKWKIISILDNNKLVIDSLNNYKIKYNNQDRTLIDIFDSNIQNLFIEDIKLQVKDLLEINYLKSSIILILKYVIYYLLLKKYAPDKSDVLKYDDLLDIVTKLKMKRFHELIKLIESKYI
jgi:hypothetical protein